MIWISEIDSAKSMEYFRTSDSILGKDLFNLEKVGAKVANSWKKFLVANDIGKKVFVEELKAQNENRFLRGRRIAFMIYDNFRITGTGEFFWFP